MSKETRLDARQLMERAVQVMGESVAERRADGKASPVVGAVLWGPEGNVQTAHRGELRDGDHAEYTLLERKMRASRLDGAVLFATLEPCAPGARRRPKLSCAERIVLARIKEVWVGIEDPDPTVDRRGIRYLQDNGVAVRMFDLDLQQQIRNANGSFLEQARQRAEEEEETAKRKPVMLSSLESALPAADMRDLSTEALDRYRAAAGIREPMDSPTFVRRLLQLGLLRQNTDNRPAPTGFGYLLFGREPRTAMPQAGVLATIHYADGREEVRDFDGPQVFAPGQALQWLRDKLPNPIDRSGARRVEANEKLFTMVREAVVNAIIHRDYAIEGAKCQLTVTRDMIEVMSPGRPVEPVTLEQMQAFNAPMLSRNPILHYVFSRMALAEERGLGLKSLRTGAEDAGLPLPRYGWNAPYLTLTLYRSAAALAADVAGPAVMDRLTADQEAAWGIAAGRESITARMLMDRLEFNERKAQRIMRGLLDAGLVSRAGAGRATRYELVRKRRSARVDEPGADRAGSSRQDHRDRRGLKP